MCIHTHYLIIIRTVTIEVIAIHQTYLPCRYVLIIDFFDTKFEK